MVDFHTYRQLHSDLPSFKRSFNPKDDSEREYLSDEKMDCDEPPGEPEIYVFPETIIGYNLHKKKWGTTFSYLRTRTPKFLNSANTF